MTSNLNSNDPFYQNGFNGTHFTSGQYFLDNNHLLQLNYQPVFEDSECKKHKLTEEQTDSEAKRLKAADSRELSFFTAPPPQSLGSNSPPSSNESSSPNYPVNQQYPFNFNDYNNQKPFATIIQTTVIDDLNRIDNVYIKKSKRDPIAEYDAELAESIEFELGLKKQNGPRKNSWGNLSYAELITRAIESSAEQRLTLSQIYDWIIKYVPYFKEKFDRTSSAGWKNSIRHNLSLHNRFIRVQNESSGKSSWWMINPDVSKYAINSNAQDELINYNFKDKIEKTKTDEVKIKKARARNPIETNFDDKAKKLKSKCAKKTKNAKKPESKAEKLDISAVDSPVSPTNFNLSNNILRTALQKPSNTPPTPSATPNISYRSYTGDFYQNTISYPTATDYSYQNNGLNKNSHYYNYQCLNNNQSYSKGYVMPQMNNSNLYFNQSYQKAPNVSSPVSTASTTSTASTSSYDLSNRLNKTGQQSLPLTPSSINSSVMNTTPIATYDDFNDLFKSQSNNSVSQTNPYSVYQTNQMTNVNNSTAIGCFYGN